MTMRKLLLSYISEFLLSNKRINRKRIKAEKQRQKLKLPHTLDVYIAINDPTSFLLLQVLSELQQRYSLTFNFKTVLNKQNEMYPEPERWDNNVLIDSIRIAKLYQLNKPSNCQITGQQATELSLLLLNIEKQPDFIAQATEIFNAVWQGDTATIACLLTDKLASDQQTYLQQLHANEQELYTKGHYLSGTIHYGGEWYWGLERLQYLEKRLNDLIPFAPQVIKFNKLHDLYQAQDKKIKENQIKDKTTPLTIYFSIRSPYSYLGLLRAIKLSEHYQIPLELKPVLPMLMRGMKVPKKKGMYIALDTKREANSYGISFGKIADPLGAGVERCYALFEYAKSLGKEVEFIKNYATAVWSQRIFSDTNQGLKQIVEQSGLDWQKAKSLLTDESWRDWADANLKELFDLGLWGVPCFKYKDTHVFGQDKLLFIEQAIRNDN